MMSGKLRWIALLLSGMLGVLPMAAGVPGKTVGNHDIYFGEWNDWVARFHTATYWFEVLTPGRGKDLFLSLESAGGTLGRSQRTWVERILTDSQGRYDHITVFTHTHFWKRDNSQETTIFKGVRYETLESLKMNDISPGYNIFSYGKDVGRSFVAVE